MGTNASEYWTPDSSFFARLPKAELLKIGREVVSNQWADARQTSKKSDIVEALGAAFDGSAEVNDATRAKIEDWTARPLSRQSGKQAKAG